jgi:hypothetical protein
MLRKPLFEVKIADFEVHEMAHESVSEKVVVLGHMVYETAFMAFNGPHEELFYVLLDNPSTQSHNVTL